MLINQAIKKYIIIEKLSLKAVTIGPDETAGSIPTFEKKRGEATPKKAPAKQAPISPIPTIIETAKGLIFKMLPKKLFNKYKHE